MIIFSRGRLVAITPKLTSGYQRSEIQNSVGLVDQLPDAGGRRQPAVDPAILRMPFRQHRLPEHGGAIRIARSGLPGRAVHRGDRADGSRSPPGSPVFLAFFSEWRAASLAAVLGSVRIAPDDGVDPERRRRRFARRVNHVHRQFEVNRTPETADTPAMVSSICFGTSSGLSRIAEAQAISW